MPLTQEIKERIVEKFINDFPDMECATEAKTARVAANYLILVLEEELEKKVEEVRSEINVELKNYTQIRDNIVKDEQYEHVPAVRFTAKKIALEDILLLPSLHLPPKDKEHE